MHRNVLTLPNQPLPFQVNIKSYRRGISSHLCKAHQPRVSRHVLMHLFEQGDINYSSVFWYLTCGEQRYKNLYQTWDGLHRAAGIYSAFRAFIFSPRPNSVFSLQVLLALWSVASTFYRYLIRDICC